MNVLILGGTRFFGISMINQLIELGYEITIATRGITPDNFGDKVSRIILDRHNPENIKKTLSDKYFDVVYDKIAYCSNDIKYLLDVISCDKYIYMSTTAVYKPKHINTIETDFNPFSENLIWCSRDGFPYDEVKRQAEYALWQKYSNINFIAVRYPVVLGKDDYTNRLKFYVEHIIKEIPMYIDNLDCQMGYINSNEAGKFLAFLADKTYKGALNGCSDGTISLNQIFKYIENKTGKKAILSSDGEIAPYNNEVEYSINTDKAKELGYKFTKLKNWIFELLDWYIDIIENEHI